MSTSAVLAVKCVKSATESPEKREALRRRAKVWLVLAMENSVSKESDTNHPEKRPGPFAQDPSRRPPTKEQRERDYQPEKRETGEAIKRAPAEQKR